MVKTRHSDELTALNEPEFLSLHNERLRRQSARANDDAEDNSRSSRAYTEGSNAFNIFEEKVVESRLRPRTGPGRAYNYVDADSSEEDIQRSRRLSGHREFPLANRDGDLTHSLRQRRVKVEMLKEEDRRSGRRLIFRGRDLSPDDDSEETDHKEVVRTPRSSFSQYCKRNQIHKDPGLRKRGIRSSLRQATSPVMKEEEESERDAYSLRRAKSNRAEQEQQQQSSDEDEKQEVETNNQQTRKSLRPQERDDHDELEDEETEHVRRSSRKRRQVFDTLNQSYLVSLPGKREEDTQMHNEDTKEDDSDENNQEFTDMYSRVKRKRIQVKRNMYGVPIDDDDSDTEENTNNNKDEDDDDDDDEEEEEQEEDEDMDNNKKVDQSRRVLRTRRSIRRPQPQKTVKSYSLRQHKPRTDLYKAPVESRRVRRVENSVFVTTPTKNNSKQPYQSPAHRRKIRKRSAFHSSSSSTSSSESESSDEKSFKRRKAKSLAKARNSMMPMNMAPDALASASVIKDRVKSGVSLADVEPMNIDKSVTFDSIGGLGKHIRKLKEMVVFPLLYDNVFQRFKVDPPRGVLFYGPPGTGKTLVARALANECSQGDRRVAFFMRKGADCLSKWVGESERQLRLLFDQAYKFRPSIIFFDEIDGLAPVRSSRQDQIHSSIVSTLLALMDGLDSRGEIVVIGATNRIDSLDPALRRPGRFDREFLFPLPSLEARKQILKIHTNSWNPRLNDHFLSELAEKCVGYCGADLKALCTEAAMQALRRRYPQIYLTNEALQLDVSSINVSAKDFYNAITSIIPTSQRSVNTPARALPSRLAPLLQSQLDCVVDKLGDIFPASLTKGCSLENAATLNQAKELAQSGIPWEELVSDEDEDAPSIFVASTPTKSSRVSKNNLMDSSPSNLQPVSAYLNFTSCATSRPTTFRPRLMVVGCEGQGQTTHLAPAIIHHMENLPIHVLDLPTLYAVTAKTPEESCANVFHEAKRKCPSILYLPYMDQWWDVMADTLRATLLTLIHDLDPALPLLLLATSERPYHLLDPTLRSLFSTSSCEVSVMRNPNKDERHAFFKDLLLIQAFKPPPQKKQAAQRMLEALPRAVPAKPRDLSPEELALLEEKEELTLMELRIFLRDVLNKLGTDKKFSIFAKPVNIDDAADYYDIIERPMDLSSMMAKIDLHEYSTVRDFLNDIDLICSNALEYNPDRGPMDRVIRHRACALKDTAYAIIKTELDKEFEKTCVEIQESRKRRGRKSNTVPNFYNTRLKHGNSSRPQNEATTSQSYLDRPQLTRTIPKPEGERYSRRVRGLDTDPVPPLEMVEKVFKSGRSGASPSREDKNDDASNEQNEEEDQQADNSSQETPSRAIENSETKESKGNNTTSSSSKKKRPICVWCRPRRKRPRLGLSKLGAKPGDSEKKSARESDGNENEELSVEEEGEEEEENASGKQDSENVGLDHQLTVDTSVIEDKQTEGTISEQRCKPSRSPASASFGVTTRRSSMSPSMATVSPLQHQSITSPGQTEDKANTGISFKESSKTDADKNTHKNTKALLLASPVAGSSTSQSQACPPDSQVDKAALGDRPSVVKRLDLDMVITDSGHGSSLESNGDSRDSTDHKNKNQDDTPVAHALPAIEALVNSNHNCSPELRTTATAILAAPAQAVVADLPRMTSLLNRLVARTESRTVEFLEKIYSQLSQLIYRHRHNHNKLPMMESMEKKVEDLTQTIPATSSNQ
ncbi:ATPase family aaa domain-containing protein 2b [Plakobranchus ocellatus]|uniref:ATPase family aaa domain-containing protein 2b n=1 Tax=Plakobranchus ocellatus TaxID=259542 RepID=A0AAV3Y9K7_9GAST|nr:ATPase family aaa domain-containing protein 2b [Plakobranchus ocellatus]